MIKNMIKTFEFWAFVVLTISTILFTAFDFIGWEAAGPMIMTFAVTLGLIGKRRAANK